MKMEEVTEVVLDVNAAPAAAPVPTPVIAEFSGKKGDFEKDMALLRAELEPTPAVDAPAPTPEATQPATTETATAPVTVPDKFKDADGNLDAAKLEKSQNAAEAKIADIEKYLETQRTLRKKEAEAAAFKSAPPIPSTIAPVNPAATQAPLTAFEIQVANDLIAEAAAYGYQMPQGQAIAQARVQVKMAEARHAAEASLTETLKEKLEAQERKAEIEEIVKNDPGLLTPAGLNRLAEIRAERPWLDNAKNPTKAAYEVYLAEQVLKSRQQGTVLPTPTGPAAKAPPTPVGPAPRAVVQSGPKLETQADVEAYVKGLTPAQETAFWKSRGLRFK